MSQFFEDGTETAMPSDDHIFVGVIEWSSDSAAEPAVTISRTVGEIKVWFRDQVSYLALEDDEPAPPPAGASYGEITEWMAEWREATTEAWLTIFRRKLPA